MAQMEDVLVNRIFGWSPAAATKGRVVKMKHCVFSVKAVCMYFEELCLYFRTYQLEAEDEVAGLSILLSIERIERPLGETHDSMNDKVCTNTRFPLSLSPVYVPCRTVCTPCIRATH